MNLVMIAVKDRAANTFARPFCVRSTAEAIRSFSDEVNKADSPLNAHPEDYDLYKIGTFDEDTGIAQGNDDGPTVIARAQDLITKPEFNYTQRIDGAGNKLFAVPEK